MKEEGSSATDFVTDVTDTRKRDGRKKEEGRGKKEEGRRKLTVVSTRY
ncbi:hypothetical protein QUB08_01900 [Microcoleus sp. BR0-C5]